MNPKFKKIFKNEYYQIIAGIVSGLILISVFINKKMFLSVFAIIGAFFIILNLIRLIDVLNGNKTNLKKLIKGTILAPIILGLFVGFVGNEFNHLGNTINDYQIFRDFGIYGFFLAIIIALISYSIKPKEKRKFSFFGLISSLIVFPLLLISSVNFINRYKAEKVINPMESIVLKKEMEIDKKDEKDSQFWIYTNVGIYNEKFKIKYDLWNKLQKKDTILLFMNNGNLGYEIVEHIEKKPTANTVYN